MLRSYCVGVPGAFVCQECGFRTARQSVMDVHIEEFIHLLECYFCNIKLDFFLLRLMSVCWSVIIF